LLKYLCYPPPVYNANIMLHLCDFLKQPAWEYQRKEDYAGLESRYWEYIRDIHFDEKTGSNFWLDRAKEFKLNPSQERMTLQEFLEHKISHFDEDVLRPHPCDYFIPRSTRKTDVEVHTSSGSVGAKKETYWTKQALAYLAHYGDYMFDLHHVPRDIDWLVTGTLLFYRVVNDIVNRRGGLVHVDLLQTRGFKRFITDAANLPPEEVSRTPFYQLTINPMMEFYSNVLGREKIGGMVVALFMLPACVSLPGFQCIRAIYLSGTQIPSAELKHWRNQLPDKIFLTSYGHHQLGLCFAHPDFEVPAYYPPAPVSLIFVVDPEEPLRLVEYGQRGRIRLLRMDEALLWVQTERDFGVRVSPHKTLHWDGVSDVKVAWLP